MIITEDLGYQKQSSIASINNSLDEQMEQVAFLKQTNLSSKNAKVVTLQKGWQNIENKVYEIPNEKTKLFRQGRKIDDSA